jgi:hypothetical protein
MKNPICEIGQFLFYETTMDALLVVNKKTDERFTVDFDTIEEWIESRRRTPGEPGRSNMTDRDITPMTLTKCIECITAACLEAEKYIELGALTTGEVIFGNGLHVSAAEAAILLASTNQAWPGRELCPRCGGTKQTRCPDCSENGTVLNQAALELAIRKKATTTTDPTQTLARELRLLTQTKAAEPLMIATCLRAAGAIEKLTAEIERLEAALRQACTPPWPEWVDRTNPALIEALVKFHLRNAGNRTPGDAGKE